MQLPSSLEAISQEWLESVLTGGTSLPAFDVHPLDANNSTTARLVFREKPEGATFPQSLFLKLCPKGHQFLGASEPNYYLRDYVGLKAAPILKCFAAAGETSKTAASLGEGYALVLEDVSLNYVDNKMIEPTPCHAARLGAALGRLHSFRWGLAADPDGVHDLSSVFDRYLNHVSRGIGPIFDTLGDSLDGVARNRLVRTFEVDGPEMLNRTLRGEGIALLHGDANPTNVLTQVESGAGGAPLYLVDRQPFEWSLRLWLGASDLVYAIVPFWPVEHRRRLQANVLQEYHRALVETGTGGYTLDALEEDWRACACIAAFTAIEWGTDPSLLKDMKWLWERQLERAVSFLLDCDAAGTVLRE